MLALMPRYGPGTTRYPQDGSGRWRPDSPGQQCFQSSCSPDRALRGRQAPARPRWTRYPPDMPTARCSMAFAGVPDRDVLCRAATGWSRSSA